MTHRQSGSRPSSDGSKKPPQGGNMSILFTAIVVVMLSFGLIIPIMPFYVESMGAGGQELGLLMATFAIMQLLFSPLWGSLSDRIGRKPVLMLGILGNAIAHLLFGLSTELWMLFASRTLAGILSSATMPAVMAYIGDTTSEEDRGGGMGTISAAMGLGMVLGPGMGGWLAEHSLAMPFFVAAGISLLVLVAVWIFLPESLPASLRQSREGRVEGFNPRQLWQSLRGPLGYPLGLAFLLSFGLTNFEGVFGLYALERYHYTAAQVGTVLTVTGLASAVAQALLTGRLSKRFGEARVIQGALLASSIGFLLMLGAQSFPQVLATTGFFVFGNAMLRPAVASLISRLAHENQGTAMGLTNSFMSMGRVVGPVWAGSALDIAVSLPYLSGAVIMGVGLLTTFSRLSPPPTPVAASHTPE